MQDKSPGLPFRLASPRAVITGLLTDFAPLYGVFGVALSAHFAEHGFREPLGAFLPLARVFRELWVI